MKILGVDPGLSDALALCCERQWLLLDMPIAGDVKHHAINGPELCRWLREHRPDHAFVEYAAARPGQGVVSMFRFGVTYGAIKMALAACDVPYTIVTPVKWKPAVGVVKGADKEASRQRALQLFPDQAANLVRRKDHARSDAILLAYYGALFWGRRHEPAREYLPGMPAAVSATPRRATRRCASASSTSSPIGRTASRVLSYSRLFMPGTSTVDPTTPTRSRC